MDFLSWLLFGALVGFIADILDTKRSGGILANICVGIAGSFVGNWLVTQLGHYFNFYDSIQTGFNPLSIASSILGAFLILSIWRVLS